jgi:hypothetical protein
MQPMPIVIDLPKGVPVDFEVMAPDAEPGEVCNRYGDIRGPDTDYARLIVKSGVVWVTRAQAKAAAAFNWEVWGQWPDDAALIQIARK